MMVTDPLWHGFAEAVDSVKAEVMGHFPDCRPDWTALSVVMPGHAIDSHRDEQSESWVCRVHVPLWTTHDALFIVDNQVHRMALGSAYEVDTRQIHAVVNGGSSPRIHLMVDIRR